MCVCVVCVCVCAGSEATPSTMSIEESEEALPRELLAMHTYTPASVSVTVLMTREPLARTSTRPPTSLGTGWPLCVHDMVGVGSPLAIQWRMTFELLSTVTMDMDDRVMTGASVTQAHIIDQHYKYTFMHT